MPGESPGSPCSALASVNNKNVSCLFVWNNVPCVTAVHVSLWSPKWLVLPATFSSYLKAGILWEDLLLGTVRRAEHLRRKSFDSKTETVALLLNL